MKRLVPSMTVERALGAGAATVVGSLPVLFTTPRRGAAAALVAGAAPVRAASLLVLLMTPMRLILRPARQKEMAECGG
jgi:hypothetical protein